jgi:hypothetical protein
MTTSLENGYKQYFKDLADPRARAELTAERLILTSEPLSLEQAKSLLSGQTAPKSTFVVSAGLFAHHSPTGAADASPASSLSQPKKPKKPG